MQNKINIVDFLLPNMNKYLEENHTLLEELKNKEIDTQRLNFIMRDYIKAQLVVLLNYDCPIGLIDDFHYIKDPRTNNLQYPKECFTSYINSQEFYDKVKKNDRVDVSIPEEFIDYVIKANKCVLSTI